MTLQPATALAAGILAVVASVVNVPRAGVGDREGAPFILPQGVLASKNGPLVATGYGCAKVYRGTQLVLDASLTAFLGPIYVPAGYTITNCAYPNSPSMPIYPVSGHELM
jgi:hypothetical protein